MYTKIKYITLHSKPKTQNPKAKTQNPKAKTQNHYSSSCLILEIPNRAAFTRKSLCCRFANEE